MVWRPLDGFEQPKFITNKPYLHILYFLTSSSYSTPAGTFINQEEREESLGKHPEKVAVP